MKKVSRRPNREAIKRLRRERKEAAHELRLKEGAAGRRSPPQITPGNRTSEYQSVEQEQEARQQTVEESLRVFRSILPNLLARFERIKDPRNPKTRKHKLTVILLYGILTFVFQMASRRQANQTMTLPQFAENLRLLFPELVTIPHHDTLNRLLAGIDVHEIESTHIELIQRFIRNKKFLRYLVANCYPIAIDGSQKFSRNHLWAEECLEKEHKGSEGEEGIKQYSVYVLEANLAFRNGMSLPLMSEILSFTEGDQDRNKQDCELKAFKRLAQRLKETFPRLPILVLVDGLYANGPVFEICRRYHWQFMIVLQDSSLPSVWEEVNGLKSLQPENRLSQNWGNRRQNFWWVNQIEYRYGENNRKKQILHVVVCEETWKEIDPESTEVVTRKAKHVWISSEPLSQQNVHERCNLGARHRWAIESNFLVEKHHGYQYEHCFSYDWQAMTGYHYLMRLGHMINILTHYAQALIRIVRDKGIRGFIEFVRDTLTGPWLDRLRIQEILLATHQIRLE